MKKRSPYFVIGMPWVAFALWLAVLWIISSLPGSDLPPLKMTYSDKVAHFGYFLIGGVILAAALFRTWAWTGWRLAAAVFLCIALLGALDEWHQSFTPKRTGSDPADWLADCLGGAAAAGLALAWIYVRRKDRKFPAASRLASQRN